MNVTSVSSGYELIKKSESLAQEAAGEIADSRETTDLKFNDAERSGDVATNQEPSIEESVLKLQQAQTYNQAGANLVARSNEIIGTLLDTHI